MALPCDYRVGPGRCRRAAMATVCWLAAYCTAAVAEEVVLVKDGVPQLPIVAGSTAEPVAELRRYLKEISGADFEVSQPGKAAGGIYVGLAADFPRLKFDNLAALGPEGFLIRSDGKSVYLVGGRTLGAQHAVTTFLHELGCRWFFPGKTWEIVPRRRNIAGAWNLQRAPEFSAGRRIWPGFGLYAPNRRDWQQWDRHNRMGGPAPIAINHTFNGLDPQTDFQQHPEWFALVDGKRQPSKPCYSHPEVLRRAVESAMKQAAAGAAMVSMSAPDGLGFCECPRCLAVLDGAEPFEEHGTLWGRRDGKRISVTSETLFRLVNRVAAAVARRHPDVRIACYAYSAYSHPPSFTMHPNVYIQTTTAFRRTPLSLDEQLTAWGEKTSSLGVREYYSVYQWDWDEPYPGRVRPDRLQRDLRFFRDHGVTAINAEASNNWGARGPGYYVASRLLWDVDADVTALVKDFYQKSFGPAAPAMERYYVRWYGPVVSTSPDRAAGESDAPAADEDDPKAASPGQLRAAYAELDEAARLVRDRPGCRERVDQVRMYFHYLCLRQRLRQADGGGDREKILAAIEAETVFGGRLNNTNMIHTRPLVGKAFLRRFRKYEAMLTELPGENEEGKLWRRLGTPPAREELDKLWIEDKELLAVADVPSAAKRRGQSGRNARSLLPGQANHASIP